MCHLLGNSIVSRSRHIKKQATVTLSTIEVEYVDTGSCSMQIWMKHQLSDYRVNFDVISIKCNNTSAINLMKFLVLKSQIKHIDVRHHFIRDHVEKEDYLIEHVSSYNQLIYIFTKTIPK